MTLTLDFDKNEALATCFRNLKGSKSKDLLLTAEALRYLKSLPEFRSNKQVGETVGVSGEIVRQFIALLDLPTSVKTYFENRTLGLEHGRRLWQLQQTRPSVVDEVAEAMASMTAMEARDLVEYLIRTPTASVQEGLQALEAAKPETTHEYHVVAILDERAYDSLEARARKQKVRVNELVSTIVNAWLEEDRDPRLS